MFIKLLKLIHFALGSLVVTIFRLLGKVHGSWQVKTVGSPILNIQHGTVELGKGVLLNSFKHDYHAAMFGRVKLFIEGDIERAIVSIGDFTRIHGSCIHARRRITIGKRCLIAANCQIIDSNGHETMLETPEKRITSVDVPRPITIEDDVWIGLNSIVLPGSHIKKGAVIPANSVVRGVVESGVVYRR